MSESEPNPVPPQERDGKDLNRHTRLGFLDLLLGATRSWQLILLAITSLLLSIASGWTTWDGMRNFTNEPVLSLLVTFGIQGVMLTSAWIIGRALAESPKASTKSDDISRSSQFLETTLLVVIALLLANLFVFEMTAVPALIDATFGVSEPNRILATVAAFLFVAIIFVRMGRGLLQQLIDGAHFALRNFVPVVIFLACMSASVFFSFDSLFTVIFPQQERERAANLRAQTEIVSILKETTSLSEERLLEEIRTLKSGEAWQTYDTALSTVASELRALPRRVSAYLDEKTSRSRTIADRQRSRILQLRQSIAALEDRKQVVLGDLEAAGRELARLRAVRQPLPKQLFEIEQKIRLQTVDLNAEKDGLGATGKSGRGPVFRELQRKIGLLEVDASKIRERLKLSEARISKSQDTIVQIRQRLQKVEMETLSAANAIKEIEGKLTSSGRPITSAQETVQAARAIGAELASSRTSFFQNPTDTNLDALVATCVRAIDTMSAAAIVESSASRNDCNASSLKEASSRLYALSAGVQAAKSTCKPVTNGDIDVQLKTARQCLLVSGLEVRDTVSISSAIATLDRNRDDKAHRFLVTLNAFLDGNRLALLALAIAIGIDMLVFVSGLFGANAQRQTPDEDGGAHARPVDPEEADTSPSPRQQQPAVTLEREVTSASLPMELGPYEKKQGAPRAYLDRQASSQKVVVSKTPPRPKPAPRAPAGRLLKQVAKPTRNTETAPAAETVLSDRKLNFASRYATIMATENRGHEPTNGSPDRKNPKTVSRTDEDAGHKKDGRIIMSDDGFFFE